MLCAIPISSPKTSAFTQRSAALYGVNSEDPQQSSEAAELQAHWEMALPEIFPGPQLVLPPTQTNAWSNACPDSDILPGNGEPHRTLRLRSVSPFDQFQLIHRWLLPEVYEYVKRYSESLLMSPDGYSPT